MPTKGKVQSWEQYIPTASARAKDFQNHHQFQAPGKIQMIPVNGPWPTSL